MLPGWSQSQLESLSLDLFEPEGVERPRAAVLFLTHMGQDKKTVSKLLTRHLQQHRISACVPDCSWWSDQPDRSFSLHTTAEKFLVEQLVPWMKNRWQIPNRAIATIGQGTGGHAALRLGFRHPVIFPIVASFAGIFDPHEWYGQGTDLDDLYESREQCRQDTAVLQIDPTRFPQYVWFACSPRDSLAFRSNERLEEKLTALGLPFSVDLTTLAAEDPETYATRVIEPLMNGVVTALEKEARRLM